MDIKIFNKHSLPEELIKEGLEFIKRRFKDDWGVTREEITKVNLYSRVNALLFNHNKVIGWVGLESNGELDNGCIEIGHKGSDLLGQLMENVINKFHCNYYSYVPIEKFGSAIACYKASQGKIHVSDEIDIRHYKEKDVKLVKIIFTDNERISKKSLIVKLNALKSEIIDG